MFRWFAVGACFFFLYACVIAYLWLMPRPWDGPRDAILGRWTVESDFGTHVVIDIRADGTYEQTIDYPRPHYTTRTYTAKWNVDFEAGVLTLDAYHVVAYGGVDTQFWDVGKRDGNLTIWGHDHPDPDGFAPLKREAAH